MSDAHSIETANRILKDWLLRKYIPASDAQEIARALLSTSDSERGMREALEKYRDDYCEGWCKENGGAGHFNDCGGCPAALALSSKGEGK